jgi:hypothetical protein
MDRCPQLTEKVVLEEERMKERSQSGSYVEALESPAQGLAVLVRW